MRIIQRLVAATVRNDPMVDGNHPRRRNAPAKARGLSVARADSQTSTVKKPNLAEGLFDRH
jgi:hypothetical protein